MLIITTIITSCNSQSVDLEKLKFDTDLTLIIDTTKFEKDNNIRYGLVGYVTEDIEKFKYGNVNFSNITIKDKAKNSLIKYSSTLSFYVDNFKSNKLSGLIIKIENENEGKSLLQYLNNKLGKPLKQNLYSEDNHIENSFLWDDQKGGQLVYIEQHTENFSEGKDKFIATEVTILKRGIKLAPDKRNNPETIKKLLEENPKAFDVLEILKSRFN